jgi:hypothetical protein
LGGLLHTTIKPNESKPVAKCEAHDFAAKPFLRGVLVYKDAFDERRTFFCFHINVEAVRGGGSRRWWKEVRPKDQPDNT